MLRQDQKSYLSLAQINNCLGSTHAVETIENILKHEVDINYRVPATSGWGNRKPESLGSTALHLAFIKNDAKSFELLLDCGADFTIKDDKGFTALHRVIEKLRKDSKDFWGSVIDNDFVSSTISAHVKSENFSNPCDVDGLTHFHIACMTNNAGAVELFLRNGVAVNLAVNTKSSKFAGWTPLHFAARSYSLETVRVLLANSANRQLKHSKHMTPSDLLVKRKIKLVHSLTIADESTYPADKVKAENEKIEETLRLLVTFNVEQNINTVDEATFHAICSLRNFSTLASFQDRLPSPVYRHGKTSQVWSNFTGLHFAAYCNVDTVILLMSKNFSISAPSASVTSAFDILSKNQRIQDVCEILTLVPTWANIVFSHGDARLTDLMIAMQDPDEFNAYLRDTVINVNLPIIAKSPLWAGYTPLHLAVWFSERFKGDEDPLTLIELCLKRGADVTVKNMQNHSPIHLAFRQNKTRVVELLLARQRSRTNPVDSTGLTHLHIACALKNVRLVRDLADHVDVNVVYRSRISFPAKIVRLGYTPLHVAVAAGCTKIVEILVKAGADVNARDGDGWSPVHRALVSPESRQIVEVLLAAPSLENRTVDSVGLSHLHVACSVDNADAVDKLLNLGADVNAAIVYKEGTTESTLKPLANFTPLDVAVKGKSTKTVELLLRRGADILAKRPSGSILLIGMLTRKERDYETQILDKLWADETLQKRLETEMGVTMLHVACRTFNLAAIADLLKTADVNVNAQVPANAHEWAGKTPLHLFLYKASVDSMRDYEPTLKMLLDKGASVTIVDAEKDTPIHDYVCHGDDRTHSRLLLDHQLDYTVNPTDTDGISHFHLACLANHVPVVKRFLESGNVDVNRPIDVFFTGLGAGCSALGLAICTHARHLHGVQSQVETVDLLLKHKADPRVEDVLGSTPLHSIAKSGPSRLELLEVFVKNGAYDNHPNSAGVTPFETLLKSRDVSVEEIDFFLRNGCLVNRFNSVTEEGYMSLLISKKHQSNQQEKAFDRVIAASNGCLRDDAGRTVIHNLVACDEALISVEKYVELIAGFARLGVDVDEQDELGKTALHVAAHFGNQKATAALLRAGADVNIVDGDDKSAFSRAVECKVKYSIRKETVKHLANHVHKLQHLKLDVSQQNKNLLKANPSTVDAKFAEQLTECCTAKRHSLDLEGFLSETGTVARYCSMMQWERARIDRFFETFHTDNDDLTELKGVLRLQYRKAVARLKLNEPSVKTVGYSVRWQLPDVPCRVIVRCMSNSDLRGLIATASEEDGECEMMDVD